MRFGQKAAGRGPRFLRDRCAREHARDFLGPRVVRQEIHARTITFSGDAKMPFGDPLCCTLNRRITALPPTFRLWPPRVIVSEPANWRVKFLLMSGTFCVSPSTAYPATFIRASPEAI